MEKYIEMDDIGEECPLRVFKTNLIPMQTR